jgi:hypothetical protein
MLAFSHQVSTIGKAILFTKAHRSSSKTFQTRSASDEGELNRDATLENHVAETLRLPNKTTSPKAPTRATPLPSAV